MSCVCEKEICNYLKTVTMSNTVIQICDTSHFDLSWLIIYFFFKKNILKYISKVFSKQAMFFFM